MSASSLTTKVITAVCTLSYPWLKDPQPLTEVQKAASRKPKFGAALVFKPGTDLKPLQAAVLAAAEAKWPGKVQDLIAKSKASVAAGGPASFKLPFRTDVADKYPEGSVYFNATSEQRPGLVYAHAAPGTSKPAPVPDTEITTVFYPGAQIRASVTAFGYDREGSKGVAFGLNNIQKIAEGERLDSRVSAEDEFVVDLSQEPADLSTLGL